MKPSLPVVYLARHGETAWSLSGQHTGLSDIPLTESGERNARLLGNRLKGKIFQRILTSPLQRARKTCELAGFSPVAQVDADLVEWNYGDFEGKTTAEIRKASPAWELFRDGCPGGESLADVAARADRVIERVRSLDRDVLLFSSGHFLRVFASRWCGWDVAKGRCLLLSTASLSSLGYDHDRTEPAIVLWNDTTHLVA